MADKPKSIKQAQQRYEDLPSKVKDPYDEWAEKNKQGKEEEGIIDKVLNWYKNGISQFGQLMNQPEKPNYNIPDPRPKSIDQANRRFQNLPYKK